MCVCVCPHSPNFCQITPTTGREQDVEQRWPGFHRASLAPCWGTLLCNLESLACSGLRAVRNPSWCFFILVQVPAHSSQKKCWSCAGHIATRQLTGVRHFSVFLSGSKEFSKF